ncbi:MAG: 3-hydroxyacyl-CoA dehydrogenase NAD-binding domain-containing protein, partial [Rhodoferax sp.]|nr:3-hydroxyacyl-CoA dehydrogenase NAD-binding domain-containing protein [Rhodoferax sp.]
MAEIETVGVVGAGTMGSGIAHVFARSGFRVLLYDVEQRFLDRALEHIRTNLGREAAKGKLQVAEIEPALARIYATTDRTALAGAEFAVEAVPERFELKAEVFRALDEILPVDAILATNTSSISITRLSALTERPTRVIGMHFFNPVPVMALVEVVRGLETSDSTYATVYELATLLGKTPVAVNDAPGFVSNRVLMPLINEAAFAVMEGVAAPEAIDQVFKLGMAHPMRPLTLADFIGLDVCVDILRMLQEGFGDPK